MGKPLRSRSSRVSVNGQAPNECRAARQATLRRSAVPLLELASAGTILAVNTVGPNGRLARHDGNANPSRLYAFDPQDNVAEHLPPTGSLNVSVYRPTSCVIMEGRKPGASKMAQPQIYEGTAEEIATQLRASNLAGKLRATIVPENGIETSGQEEPIATNEQALAIMRQIAARHKGRRTTDNGDTQRLLREARAGAAYGYDPRE